MRIRYYVLAAGDQFKVLREAKAQGFHPTRQRAMEAAIFMASIEAGKQQVAAELFVEDDTGRLVQGRVIEPRDQIGLSVGGRPTVLRVGCEEVLLPA